MNTFGAWQEHDAAAHNAKVARMKTARQHNIEAGMGEVEIKQDSISSPEIKGFSAGGQPADTTPRETPTARRLGKPDAENRCKRRRGVAYSRAVVLAWFEEQHIPDAEPEWIFAYPRKWRFDLAWPQYRVALEVQGGIFSQGRHTRGAALLKEWEKLNEAACLGWRILFCQPKDLCTLEVANQIKRALGIKP